MNHLSLSAALSVSICASQGHKNNRNNNTVERNEAPQDNAANILQPCVGQSALRTRLSTSWPCKASRNLQTVVVYLPLSYLLMLIGKGAQNSFCKVHHVACPTTPDSWWVSVRQRCQTDNVSAMIKSSRQYILWGEGLIVDNALPLSHIYIYIYMNMLSWTLSPADGM